MRDADGFDAGNRERPEKGSAPSLAFDGVSPAGERAVATSREELERFRDAIIAEFDAREDELNRRERSLGEQLAALDRERRASRLAAQSFEQKAAERESALVAKEADFAHRLARCEELIAELEDEQAAVDLERAGLVEQKQAIRDEILSELAVERQAIDTERESLFAEKRELRRRIALHEQEAASARDELRQSWEVERETLRRQLTSKLAAEHEAERRVFEQERSTWEERRREEQATFEQDRADYDRQLERAKAELERLRREQEIEFARRRRELEAEIEAQVRSAEAALQQQQAEWETVRGAAETELRELRIEQTSRLAAREQALVLAREDFEKYRDEQLARIAEDAATRLRTFEAERAEWNAARDAEAERLAREAAALDDARTQFEAEQQQRRERVTAELAEVRRRHERELADERDEFARQCEADRLALDEERAVMENRLHFQQEHLDRTRDELEEARRELDRRLQTARAQAAALGEQLRLRQSHLLRFRGVLDEREAMLERERALVEELRDRIDDERRRSSESRAAEDVAWQRAKEAEQVALDQLREELASRSAQLSTRQARLDTLRVELETTHRENLELRVALDETWVKLAHAAEADLARQELQTTRMLVAEHFREKEAELDRRRKVVVEDAAGARQVIDQIDAKRRELSEWLSDGLANLHRREEELKRWATALAAREARSDRTISRWHAEKAEAERVIRGLLRQLTDAMEHETPAIEPVCREVPPTAGPVPAPPHFRPMPAPDADRERIAG